MRTLALFVVTLAATPALAGPMALNCPAGAELVEIKPGQFSCKQEVPDWKPVKAPTCRSGERVQVNAGTDKCRTPATPAETKDPTCSSGWTYQARNGQDVCVRMTTVSGQQTKNPSCMFMKPGNVPDVWPYQIQDGKDTCLKPGTGTEASVADFPSNACLVGSKSFPLRADLDGQKDMCAAKGTKTVYTTPTQGGGSVGRR